MRKIPLNMVKPNMLLAKNVFNDSGQILIRANVEIKPRYLTYLEQQGIEHVYVRDERLTDVEVEDPITEKTRYEARNLVKNITRGLQTPGTPENKTKSINVQDREILNTVNKIIDELLNTRDVIVQLDDIRSKDDYLFAHSVNCAVLATLVARKMQYKPKELRWLATGALFHDLGMTAMPANIINKAGELTEEEFKKITEHPLLGFKYFKTTDLFDARAGAIVLQHHERFQGQGYPRGLAGKEINPLAHIAGIADVYDALTSDRPYRKAYKPHEALEMLMSWGEEFFEINILQNFVTSIAAYPMGVHVVLSNEESGLVIANNPGFTMRPKVRVLYADENMTDHPTPYDIDLSQALNLTIVKVID